MENKVCSICKIEKEIESFARNKSSKDGHNSRCRSCMRLYYQQNCAKIKERIRKNTANNKERYASYQAQYRSDHRKESQEYNQFYKSTENGYIKRKNHALSRYGISFSDYTQLLESQHDVCAICKQAEQVKQRSGKLFSLSVDHCHTSGKVRGLLCRKCNSLIAYCKEDINTLYSAIDYLSRYKNELD